MARKGIREYDAKRMLARDITGYEGHVVLVGPGEDLRDKVQDHPWLAETKKFVAKPDQLFGKRGKNGLVLLNKGLEETAAWIKDLQGSEKTLLSGVTGTLSHFLVEPFTPFEKDPQPEYYVQFDLDVDGDIVRLSNMGGVDVEENWDKVREVHIPVLSDFDPALFAEVMNDLYPAEEHEVIMTFLADMHKHFRTGGYTFLEINPFVVINGVVDLLDTVAKVDDTAAFECRGLWGSDLEYPAAFGATLTEEEAFIRELDSKTGASLKLTVLNPKGRVWNMVAGGGASVVYADTVCDLGHGGELAIYGEYSGNPDTYNTYQYAKTVLDMMTREKDPEGRPKFLLVGGGIANFTDVAKTFKGIIMALEEYSEKMKDVDARIYVRRGGPNYQKGLADIKSAAERLGLPIQVGGPETHITKIVADAFQG